MKPPLSEAKQAEEEDLEEDFDTASLVVSREDPGPPSEHLEKGKERKKGLLAPAPSEEIRTAPPDGFTLSNKKIFEYRTQFSRPADLNWSGSLSVTTTTLGPMAGMSAR